MPTNFPTPNRTVAHVRRSAMKSQRLIFLFLTMCTAMAAQHSALPAKPSTRHIPAQKIALTVARNTPLQIALDRDVRIRKVGQPIQGHLIQPVYAFDRLVAPAGTEVDGHIARIESLSRKKRVLGILNADFTPERKVEVQFDQLVLANGRTIPFKAVVTPGSGRVMQLISANHDNKKKAAKHSASETIDEAKQEAMAAMA